MTENAKQLYNQREARILDATALKEPDRVPIVPLFAYFNCYFSGITPREAFTVPEKAFGAWRKTVHHFQPDATYNLNAAVSATDEVLAGLDFKAMKWGWTGESCFFGRYEYFPSNSSIYPSFYFWPFLYLHR